MVRNLYFSSFAKEFFDFYFFWKFVSCRFRRQGKTRIFANFILKQNKNKNSKQFLSKTGIVNFLKKTYFLPKMWKLKSGIFLASRVMVRQVIVDWKKPSNSSSILALSQALDPPFSLKFYLFFFIIYNSCKTFQV